MKAAYINEPGPPESIIYGDLPEPRAAGSQVLVKVGAAALNPVDTYVRAGLLDFELPKPFIVGCDLAGTVQAVGPAARRFRPGDRVWGSNQGLLGRQGTFAEFAAVDEEWLYPTPANVGDKEAAATALVGITAHLGLVQRAVLKPGESVFVVGATGGVGSTVLQMAKAIGARVACCSGSDEKCARARSLGADLALNYRSEKVVERAREFSPGGYDVFWETRREPDFDLAIDLLADRGRMILMAGRGAVVPFPVGPFYFKQCSVLGFVMFRCSPEEQRACAGDINRWLAGGQLKANIDRVMPLRETAAAHRLQEDNTLRGASTLAGKIVVVP